MKRTILSFCLLLVVFASTAQTKYSKITSETERVTKEYIKNYFDFNFDKLKEYMHDSITFQDPTAKFVFSGKLVEGKETLYKFFTNNYASIHSSEVEIQREIVSSGVGIYEINLTWSFANDNPKKEIVIEKMPMVIVLSTKDGKVIQHRDYGDYKVFIQQYENQLKNEG
jgi:ketosteroid isomerase-like protein